MTTVFQRIREAGLKLSPPKCSLALQEVTFLGHIVSARGVEPDPKKLAAISATPPPTTVTQVRSFLGLAGYYRRFIKNFSSIATPLHNLTHHGVPWKWTEECNTAFNTLKDKLTSAPIVAFPDFSIPFRLYTDASDLGLGAVLAQVQDNRERIIACASRTLRDSEKNYSVTKKECLAIIWAIGQFRSYLIGKEFLIYTDHYSLQWLRSMKAENRVLHQWACSLEDYQFTICHRPGKLQTHVDALSRLPLASSSASVAPSTPVPVSSIVVPPAEALRLINFSREVQEELDQIAESLGPQPSCKSDRRIIEGRAYDTEGHLVLGHLGAKHAMELLHHAAGGHLGWRKTRDKFCQRFCANNTTTLAKEVVASCVGCQKATDYKPRPAPAGSIRTSFPWDILAIDVMGPFPPQQGKQYVISCLDAFSRFTILVPVPGHTASAAARVLFTHVIAVFGVPSRILSDQGPEFTGKVWDELQEFLGCTLIRTSPYHPQGNGAVERCHRTVNNIVRAIIHSTSPSLWPEAIPCAQLALNSAPSDTHGYSPFEIVFGHLPRLPAEQHIIQRQYDPSETPCDQYLGNLRRTLANAHQLVRQHTNKPYVERENPFSAGQFIWVLAPPYARPNKLSPKWLGPYEVQATPNPFQVILHSPRRVSHSSY